jgi:hypothetical protein
MTPPLPLIACCSLAALAVWARAEQPALPAAPAAEFAKSEREKVSSGSSTSARAAASHLLRTEHTYDPSVRERALQEAEAEAGVVQMDAVVLTETGRERLLSRYLEAQRHARAAQRPSLAQGFSLPGVPAVGVKPYNDILSFGPPLPRVNLLEVKW